MKKIDKFLIKSYLGPMVLTFFIVMFILLMNIVWRYIDELVGKGLSLGVIMEFLFYAVANMIPLGIPLATLLAAIMTLGNLGENYELLAMKSCGMSLPRILKSLTIVVIIIAIGSFFVANNLVPYSNKKMIAMRSDIQSLKQQIEFQNGVFFNGIEDMSIRVDHQDRKTNLLTGVLIYDTSQRDGTMLTTIADSGYIRMSNDNKYLLVDLYNGESYKTTRDRNQNWYDANTLEHNRFKEQSLVIGLDGFAFQRSDADYENASTKTVVDLRHDVDSLQDLARISVARSYEPLLRTVLPHDNSLMGIMDSVKVDYSYKQNLVLADSVVNADLYKQRDLIKSAISKAKSSLNHSYDEDIAKITLNELYQNQVELHRKISLPFSIIIFFLIGAPLGAIIRRGGLGMPTVVSVLFFVVYYVISITGEKMAKDGAWSAFTGMWISSFILTPIAAYLTYKATNDSNLFNMDWYRMQYDKLKIRLKKRINKNKKSK